MIIDLYDWVKDGKVTSRPCSFCLCLQGGSVFADFRALPDERVALLRISFDGYGCYINNGVQLMNPEDSRILLQHVHEQNVDCEPVRETLYRFFEQNQDVICRDALLAHELLR